LGALPFEEEIIERSTWIDVGGLKILVASAEDLVIMKAVAGRGRDVVDIENIIDANPDANSRAQRRMRSKPCLAKGQIPDHAESGSNPATPV
ncbi:MAG: nucleotidyltransferase, partial [Thermoanaerobaculia bacterium]